MLADRADVRGFVADVNVSAVAAFPASFAGANPDFALFDVLSQFEVSLFVPLFNQGDGGKLICQFRKPFFAGDFGKALVHVRPFFVLASGSRLDIFQRTVDAVQSLEPELGVLFFVVGGQFKQSGDLFVAVLLRSTGEIRVLVARHGLAGKGVFEVRFRLASLKARDGVRRVRRFLDEFASSMLAPRADKIVWHRFAFVDVTADRADPARFSRLFRSRFNVFLIVRVRSRRNGRKNFGVFDVGEEHQMRSQVDGLENLAAKDRVGSVFNRQDAVRLARGGEVSELVNCLAALESKAFEQVKGRALRNNRDVERASAFDHAGGVVALVERNADAAGIAGNLNKRVGNTAVVFAVFLRRYNVQPIPDLK